MKKEKYINPFIEIIDFVEDIITTSQTPYDPFDPYPEDDPGWDPFSI